VGSSENMTKRTFLNRIVAISRIALLGSTFFEKVRIFFLWIYLFVREKISYPSTKIFFLDLTVLGTLSRIAIGRFSHFQVIKDILVYREYDREFAVSPKTILDLGASIGISPLFFALKYPNAKIYAVEPHPEVYELLVKNTKVFPNIVSLNYAIAEKSGNVDFYLAPKDSQSSLVQKTDTCVTVEGISPDDLLKKLGLVSVDLLKFDIEGAEQYLFKGFNGFSAIPSYIGEMHYELLSFKKGEIQNRFSGYDFKEEFLIPEKFSLVFLEKC
jgi:FkbM family methyltransferase